MKIQVTNVRLPTVRSQETMRDAVAAALQMHARDVLAEAARLLLSGSRSGRTHRHGGVMRQASAPGEPQAVEHGRLVESGKVGDVNTSGSVIEVAVSWGTAYALWLEKGTRRMQARPFARPAALKLIEQGRARLAAAADEALTS